MTSKFHRLLLFLSIVFLSSILNANYLESPEGCYKQQNFPCLIKTTKPQNFIVNETVITALAKTSFLVATDPKKSRLDINLLTGKIKVNSVKGYSVNQYQVSHSQPLFVSRLGDRIELIDSDNLDMKIFEVEKNSNDSKSSKNFIFSQNQVLSRPEFENFISAFYIDKNKMVKEVLKFSQKYQSKLDKDLDIQTKVLQENIDRKIASDKIAAEARRIKAIEESTEKKRIRELFFIRTFER